MYGASSCGYLQPRSPAGAGVRSPIAGFRAVYVAPIKSSDGISARCRLYRERRGCLQGYVPVSRSPTPYDALQAGGMLAPQLRCHAASPARISAHFGSLMPHARVPHRYRCRITHTTSGDKRKGSL